MGRYRKKPYPKNSDIEKAIIQVLSSFPLLSPDDFPQKVRIQLKEKGFYSGLVTNTRVWRLYENLVRKGKIFDILMVVKGYGADL